MHLIQICSFLETEYHGHFARVCRSLSRAASEPQSWPQDIFLTSPSRPALRAILGKVRLRSFRVEWSSDRRRRDWLLDRFAGLLHHSTRSLTSLHLEQCAMSSVDVASLSRLSSLRSLTLDRVTFQPSLVSLSPLRRLPLTSLTLSTGLVHPDPWPFSDLSSLPVTSLSIEGYEPDAGALKELNAMRLRTLSLTYILSQHISLDVLALPHLTDLKAVCVSGIRDTSLSFLANLPSLRNLRLISCHGLTDGCFEPIARALCLRKLELSNTKVTGAHLRQLSALPHLETLDLSGSTKLQDEFADAFLSLHSLRRLLLTRCTNVTDWTGVMLSCMPSLESIEAWDAGMSDDLKDSLREFTAANRERKRLNAELKRMKEHSRRTPGGGRFEPVLID